MGQVANAVKHTATGAGRAVRPHGLVNSLARNASTSMSQASRTCPVVSEFANITQGIAQGDFTKAAVNTGILALAAAPAAGASGSKVLTQSSTKSAMRIAALSAAGSQGFGAMSSNATRQYTQTRSFASFQKAELKPLPFAIDALEPVVSKSLMEYHYGKHHATYVNNFNALQEKAAEAMEAGDHQKYTDLSQGIKFNGGGHQNHEFFWEGLSPVAEKGGKRPVETSDLHKSITHAFGSFDKFIAHFSANTAAVQGSGWGWLALNKVSQDVEFRTTANQDRLVDQGAHLVPLLTVDIWEHAYYLDYQNVRPNFLKEVWKIVNWEKVADRLAAARLTPPS